VARKLARDQIDKLEANRQVEESKRQQAERICRSDGDMLITIWNDLAELEKFQNDADPRNHVYRAARLASAGCCMR
jgi:hypothetical protein